MCCPTIVVTAGTVRTIVKTSIKMAVATVQIDVVFIKFQPGDRVHKIVAIPSIMTVIAVCIHLRHSLSARVTGGTLQLTVVSTQTPVGRVVLKRWFFFVAVTLVATVTLVAVIADGMNLFF